MRKFAVMALAVALVALGAASVSAQRLEIHGWIQSDFKYSPEDKLEGSMSFGLNSSIAGGPSGLTFYLGWFEQYNKFWNAPSGWGFIPTTVQLKNNGQLWTGGPKLNFTLGDFDMPLPVYLNGQWPQRGVRGAILEDVNLANVKATAFMGWPEEYYNGKGHVYYGGKASTKLGGLDLTLYTAARKEVPNPQITAADGAVRGFDGKNSTRWANYLILVTPGNSYDFNPWGTTVWIDANGIVTAKTCCVATSGTVTSGYVVSGNGTSSEWLDDHVNVGDKVDVVDEANVFGKATSAELDIALEAAYDLQGKGKVTVQTGSQQVLNSGSVTSSKFVKAGTSYKLDQVLPVPVTLTAGFRQVDANYEPWARNRDTNVNPIEAIKGQTGYNVGVSGTAKLSGNVANWSANYDTYTKASVVTNTTTLSGDTKIQGANLTGSITSVRNPSTTNTYKLGVSKEYAVASATKVTPSYNLTVTQGSTTTTTNEIGAKVTTDVAKLKGVIFDLKYTLTQSGSASTGKLSAAVTYDAPNKFSFTAGYASPDDPTKTDDTYLKLTYKITL